MKKAITCLLVIYAGIVYGDEGSNVIRVDMRQGFGGRLATGIEMVGEEDGSAYSALDTTGTADGWWPIGSGNTSLDVCVLNTPLVVGGRLYDSETWMTNRIYVVRDNIVIPSGVVLTIQNGCIVKFTENARIYCESGGRLDLQGATLANIADDSVGGDTNLDGDTTSPVSDDWLWGSGDGLAAVEFKDGDTSTFRLYSIGSVIGVLLLPDRQECTFDGWWTAASGGTRVNETTVVSGDVTYYAHWSGGDMPSVVPEVPDGYGTYNDGMYTWVWRETDGGVCLMGFYQYNGPDDHSQGGQWMRGIYPAPKGDVTIPVTVNGQPVVALDNGLFVYCEELTGVVIPATVRFVGDDVFRGTGVRSVHLPDAVETIGCCAFYGSQLETINVPESLETVEGLAFHYTPWMRAQGDFVYFGSGNLIAYQGAAVDVVVPSAVRVVSESAFDGCAVASVFIPGSVERICDYAFTWCGELADVSFGGDMWVIKMNVNYAFYGTPWLNNLKSDPPENGLFANAAELYGISGSTRGYNVGATVEEGEPASTKWYSAASVWWCWTASESGFATFNTFGSSFDTVLGVYIGDAVSALETVVENDDVDDDDDYTSSVTFKAVKGQVYYIAVAGYRESMGGLVLNWSLDAESQPLPTPQPGSTSGTEPQSPAESQSEPTSTPQSEPATEEKPVLWPDGAVDAVPGMACEYNGRVVDADGNLKGTIQVKVGKPGKTGESAVKATVQMAGGKKTTLKASGKGKVALAKDGSTTMALSGGAACTVTLGSNSMSGRYGEHLIDGSRSVFASKDKAEAAAAARTLAALKGTYNVFWGDGTVSVTVAAKGKAKAKGTLAGGGKFSASNVLLVGEKWACVPVVSAKSKTAFTLWIAQGAARSASAPYQVIGLGEGVKVGKAGTVSAGAAFCIDVAAAQAVWGAALGADFAQYLPNGVAVKPVGAKWAIEKGGRLAMKGSALDTSKAGTNPSGLKLSYKAADGSFKGSFKVYNTTGGKLKATTVNVTGVMVGNIGYGTASVKGKGSVSIEIR